MTTISSGTAWAHSVFTSQNVAGRQDGITAPDRAHGNEQRRANQAEDKRYGLNMPYGANPIENARAEDQAAEVEATEQGGLNARPGLKDAEIIASVLETMRQDEALHRMLQERTAQAGGGYGGNTQDARFGVTISEPKNIFAEGLSGDDMAAGEAPLGPTISKYAETGYMAARNAEEPSRLDQEAEHLQKVQQRQVEEALYTDRKASLDLSI